jgi:hypothetical protein
MILLGIDMKVGNKIKLAGVTRHGKNRIRENGAVWEVITVLPTKVCVVPCEESHRENWRWVDISGDQHMEIVETSEFLS